MLSFIAALVCALSMALSVSVEADAFLHGASSSAPADPGRLGPPGGDSS